MPRPSESITVTGDGPSRVTIKGEGITFLQWVRDCADWEDSVVQALKELHGGKGLHHEEWREKDGLVLYRGRVYVPPNGQPRHDRVNALHNSPIAGHAGQWKTTDLVARNFWWPGMGRYIAEYTKGCNLCNRTKNYPSTPAGKLMPNRIPDCRWQTISVDLITELPQSHRYDTIMVVIDCFSKCTHTIPTTSDVTASGVAQLFRDHVWKLHGLPEEVISDRGTQFVSNFVRSLSQLLKIRIVASTTYHPQTDGQTERVNQEVKQFLRLL